MIINNIGFMLIEIEDNEYYHKIFNNINQLIINNPNTNICIFSSTCNKVDTLNIPVFHLAHAKFFKGMLWTFDIASLLISKNFSNITQKILYTNDMPWIKNTSAIYKDWKKIYSDINFIVSNQYLYDIYDILWSEPLCIMEEFNYEQIQQLLQPV